MPHQRLGDRRLQSALLSSSTLLAIGLCACGGADGVLRSPPLSFSGATYQSVASGSGKMQIGVRWSPQAPAVGVDAGEFTVTDTAGAPLDGLALTIVPWMPAHGHGTSVTPEITETSPGVFVATPLYLYMSGHWDLRTTISGAEGDTATPSVDLR